MLNTIVIAGGVILQAVTAAAETSASPENSAALKVFAVKYGDSLFPKSGIFHGDKSKEKVPFCWLFYYIEYKDRKILVDTGFNEDALVKSWGISNFKDPETILRENGVPAGDITDVIITHAHFDHIGCLHRFPNARVFINRREFNAFMRWEAKTLSDRKNKEALKDNPRVTIFDKEETVCDFFKIKTTGGHTGGSAVVFFSFGGKQYCLVGDEAYSADNFKLDIGSGSAEVPDANLKFIHETHSSDIVPLIFHDSRYYIDKRNFIQTLP
jgi:glyoxylase-like metal-dependent hydrolase (beta-lactamase superfamily II)